MLLVTCIIFAMMFPGATGDKRMPHNDRAWSVQLPTCEKMQRKADQSIDEAASCESMLGHAQSNRAQGNRELTLEDQSAPMLCMSCLVQCVPQIWTQRRSNSQAQLDEQQMCRTLQTKCQLRVRLHSNTPKLCNDILPSRT